MQFLVAFIALVSSVQPAHADSGRISGSVSDRSGNPLPDICVGAIDFDTWEDIDWTTTAADGSYTLATGAGDFAVHFYDCVEGTYLQQWYQDASSIFAATRVTVALDQEVLAIDASLRSGGSISGSITTVSGEDAAACVDAYDESEAWVGGDRALTPGSYAVRGLPAGTYFLRFSDCGGAGYATQWYDNQRDFASAAPIDVAEGVDTGGVDVQMHAGASISGTVTDPDGGPIGSVCVSAFTVDNDAVETVLSAGDGMYSITGLAADTYFLQFQDCDEGIYRTLWFLDQEAFETADPVVVAEGETVGNIDQSLPRRGVVRGTVTDPAGVGVANICVIAYDQDGRFGGQGSTHADGTYRLVGLEATSVRLHFRDCGGAVYQDVWYHDKGSFESADPVPVGEIEATGIDQIVHPSGRISGHVRDASGATLADMCVSLYDDATAGHVGWSITDDDGSYRLGQLDAGYYRLAVTDCSRDEYLPSWYLNAQDFESATPVYVAPESETSGIDPVMTLGGSISGTVRDKLGNPLSGICVRARSATFSSIIGSTAANGTYRVVGLPGGDYKVRFTDCGRGVFRTRWHLNKSDEASADTVPVIVSIDTPAIDAVLPRKGSIQGTVTDTSGQPLRSICVTAQGDAGWGGASTASDGSYMIEGLDAGDYHVRFHDNCGSNGYLDQWYQDADSEASSVQITVVDEQIVANIDGHLALGGSISGVVRDGAGEPLEWACVTAFSSPGVRVGSAYADGDGRYRIKKLRAGNYRLRFEDCGYDQHLAAWYEGKPDFAGADPVEVTLGEETPDIDMILRARAAVSGTVRDATGRRLAGICVSAYDGDGDELRSTTTGASGGYLLRPLPEGAVTILFEDCWTGTYVKQWYDGASTQADATPVSVRDGGETPAIDAELIAGATILGTVRRQSGSALSGACVDAYDSGLTVAGRGTTSAGGRYRISGLLPGDYRVRFSDCGNAQYAARWFDGASGYDSATTLTLAEAATRSGIDAELIEYPKPPLQYFGLGDATAAGTGLSGAADACGRTAGAYPRLVATLLGASHSVEPSTLACAGARASAADAKSLPAQIDALGRLRDRSIDGLASISIGWRDVFATSGDARHLLCDASETEFENAAAAVASTIASGIADASVRALSDPKMRIAVTEMYQPLNTDPTYLDTLSFGGGAGDSTCDPDYPRSRVPHRARERMERFIAIVNGSLLEMENGFPDDLRARFRLIGAEHLFYGHEAPRPACGAGEPSVTDAWIQGAANPAAPNVDDCILPNAAGAAALAQAIVDDVPDGSVPADRAPPWSSFSVAQTTTIRLSAAGDRISGQTSDARSGIDELVLDVSSVAGSVIHRVLTFPDTGDCTPGRRTCSFTLALSNDGVPIPPGVYTLTARARDRDGNTETPKEFRFVAI